MKENWQIATLGEIVTFQSGVGFPLDLQGKTAGDYPLAKVGDISRVGRSSENVISAADHYVDSQDLIRLKTKPIPQGSVLFAKIGESIRNNHKVLAGCSLLIDNNAMAAIPSSRINSQFLFYCMRSIDLNRVATSTTVPSIRKSELEKLQIPLPPLPEQRRIAQILDKAEALRAKRRTALAKLDTLAQSIFLEMFGDPVQNDKKWPVAFIKDFVAGFESGKSIVADDADDCSSTYRVLKISAITSLEYRPGESKALPPDYVPPKAHFVRDGDLLFSRANTTELIGATAFIFTTPPNLLLPDKLWRFVWHDKPRADPQFVRFLFQRPKFRSEIGARATGSSGSMKNISQDKVLTISVGLPPLPLQQAFARRVEAIETLKAAHRASLAKLDALFASLQHQAFRGEL